MLKNAKNWAYIGYNFAKKSYLCTRETKNRTSIGNDQVVTHIVFPRVAADKKQPSFYN